MKNILSLLLVIVCFTIASAYAVQIPDRGKSMYKNHTGTINSDTIFRVK